MDGTTDRENSGAVILVSGLKGIMRMWHVLGKVMGKTRIEDLNVTIKHEEIITILEEKAERSEDLLEAIKNGWVTVVKRTREGQTTQQEARRAKNNLPFMIKRIDREIPQTIISPDRLRMPGVSTQQQAIDRAAKQEGPVREIAAGMPPDQIALLLASLPDAIKASIKEALAALPAREATSRVEKGGGFIKDSTPVEVILGEAPEATSNISQVQDIHEKSAVSIKEKLRKKKNLE